MALRRVINPRSSRSRRIPCPGFGAGRAAALVAVGLAVVTGCKPAPDETEAGKGESRVVPRTAEADPALPGAAVQGASPESKRLADAFEAATGYPASYTVLENGYTSVIRPLRIVELPFGPALLTEQDSDDACHACAGAIGIYYLREKAGKLEVSGSWPRAVEGWGWGHPPTDWSLTDRFTAYPAIYASGGYLAQGIMTEGATITELRPSGPVTSDLISTSYDDEGGAEEGERSCQVTGRIANVRKDRSFDVLVTGSVKAVDHYVKRNGRFVARRKIRWDLPCGYSDGAEG